LKVGCGKAADLRLKVGCGKAADLRLRIAPLRIFTLMCTLTTSLLLEPAPLEAATREEQAVLAPLQGMLDGIAKRDKAAIREHLLPGGTATLVHGGKILQISFEAFVDRLPATGTARLEERIYGPLIRIDDDIAVIWAPYDFFIDGKVDHCGTDTAHLVRRDGRWLIASLGDNTHKTCPPRTGR